ncbi:JAB domain-containing protein [Sporosarcina sp. A2]|uniref:JAB domain-containing protein n=1 Tax=Sporosarcina sp. A2 TaxID=3393449 RepID=UPI003D79BC77
MRKHNIEIKEIFTLNMEVEATTEKEAVKTANELYCGEEMDLRENEDTKVETTIELAPVQLLEPVLEVLRIKQVTTLCEEESPYKITQPADIAHFAHKLIGDEDREVFLVICLTTKNQVSAVHRASIGNLNSSIVSPREVFKTAILNNASSIVVAHNHPSFNNTTPSKPDIEVTQRLVECGELLGIELLDHVILSGDKYVSLKEKGYM